HNTRLRRSSVNRRANSAASSVPSPSLINSTEVRSPYVMEFRRDRLLPSLVFGPVDCFALRRLAASFFAEIGLPLPGFFSLRFSPGRGLVLIVLSESIINSAFQCNLNLQGALL